MPVQSPTSTNKQSGTSLIEVLIVIVLIGLVVIPVLLILLRLNRSLTRLSRLSQGVYYTQRNLEIITNISQQNWSRIEPLYDPEASKADNQAVYPFNQTYHLQKEPSGWQLVAGSTNIGPYTTQITFQPVCRDSELDIAPCTDATNQLDFDSIQVTSYTQWSVGSITDSHTQKTTYTNLYTIAEPST